MSVFIPCESQLSYQDALIQFKGDKRSSQHMAEAEFGFKYVSDAIKALPKGASVLEIGSGSALLISQLAQSFPNKKFIGLEPMGDGFSYVPAMHKFADSLPNACIRPVGFEALKAEEKFDFIFLINVFEHLPDWKLFLDSLKTNLKPDGVCIILCPNYSFPYEPHFRLPIFLNKGVTYLFFKRAIAAYELREEASGLWTSLNFVKLRQVKTKTKDLGLNVQMEKDILEDMMERLESDPEFSKRQGLLKLPILLVQKLGLLNFVLKSSIFENYLPYMHLTVSHRHHEMGK